MRIYLIVDETNFYQPDFISDLIKNSNYNFVGAALVTKILPKSNLERYMLTHFWYLKPRELVLLGIKKINFILKNFLSNNKKQFYSVKSVLDYYNVDYIKVQNNINEKFIINSIKSKYPDVIVSSNSLIFNDEIIKLPKLACINRHSSLLPSYGGLWPILQAYRSGEKEVGVTVHTMTKKIDKGIILSQKKIQISDTDTVDSLYQKCFSISASVVIESLNKIEKNNFTEIVNDYKSSYYSFPQKKHWQEFRQKRGRFI